MWHSGDWAEGFCSGVPFFWFWTRIVRMDISDIILGINNVHYHFDDTKINSWKSIHERR